MSLEQAPTGPPHGRREPVWVIVMYVSLAALLAFVQALGMQIEGFAWWRVAGVFFLGIFAGTWLAYSPPFRRLLDWRSRKYGVAADRPRH